MNAKKIDGRAYAEALRGRVKTAVDTLPAQPTLAVVLVGEDPASCLLYTSPSPRDGLLSRMPSSA